MWQPRYACSRVVLCLLHSNQRHIRGHTLTATLSTPKPEVYSPKGPIEKQILEDGESVERILEDYLLDIEYEEAFRPAVLDIMCG